MFATISSRNTSAARSTVGANPSASDFKSGRTQGGRLWLLATLLIIGVVVGPTPALHAQNIIHTIAGGAVPSGLATTADIPGPTSVAKDASGNIYIAAPSSYYLFKVSSSGSISVFAGVGISGFSGDNGPATQAALSSPVALAVDNTGNVYFADGNRIRQVTTDGNIHTIAGDGQVCRPSWGVCGDGVVGGATQSQMDTPQGLAVDGSGNVYIADTGDNRIRLVSNGTMTTVAGTGHICDSPINGCGDKGSALNALLDLPNGVAVDASGNVYIADTRDQRIRCVLAVLGGCADTTQRPVGSIVTFAGTGQICPAPNLGCGDTGVPTNAKLANPSGMWLDATGNLYFADQLDHRIRKITSGANSRISTVAGNGTQSFSGDGGPATSAGLDLPYGVVGDSTGTLWIADTGNQRTRQVLANNISTFAGGGMGGDGGAPALATLANPNTVAWDSAGNYYIADTANNRIRKVTPGTNSTIATVAGTGNLGYGGEGGPATSALLYAPGGIAVDAAGNIFIADTGNYIIREVVAATGNIITVAGMPGQQCIGTGVNCGDNGPATAGKLANPTSIAIDNNGNLLIADNFGNRVRKVSGDIITTVAGTGVRGYGGDNGPATSALLNHPYGVTVDASGNIYIADGPNNRIRCVLTVTGGCGGSQLAVGSIVTYAFNGQAGFSGDGGLAKAAKQTTPLEVAMDPFGNLFVGGGAYAVVRRIDGATQTAVTVAGTSQSGGFGGDGNPATKSLLSNLGLAVNSAQSLLIADAGNNRIRQVNLVPVLTASTAQLVFPVTPVGHTSAPKSVKLSNIGAADQPLGAFSITGPNAPDFAIVTNTCGTLLAPALSCTITITFTPQAPGARSGFLKMAGFSQRLPLSGTGQ